MTGFWENVSNFTSGVIKLTPPVDSYTTTDTDSQHCSNYLRQTSFLGGVVSLNGGFWPCEGPGFTRISGTQVDGLIYGWPNILCVVLAVYQPLKSQHSPVILCLDFSCGHPSF